MEKFKNYIIQDSIYLKQYARVFGKLIYHSTVLKDIQLYYHMLDFVSETESAVRLNYLKRFGMTDDDIEFIQPLPENQSYIRYILDIAEQGNICEMLMTALPCMMSYCYIFRKLMREPETVCSRYTALIQDYADEKYYENNKAWSEFANRKCDKLSEMEKEKLSRIFERASLFELAFWEMAYA